MYISFFLWLLSFLEHIRLMFNVGKLGIFYLKYVQRKFIAMCVLVVGEKKLVRLGNLN